MSAPKIVLHWLDDSRSQRLLWLLEELELAYDLRIYKRNDEMRADAAILSKVHPLAKLPLLEIDGKVLAESGYIFQYLLEHYDTGNKLSPTSLEEKERVTYYLHYSEGSLSPFLTQFIVFDTARARAPYLKKAIANTVLSAIEEKYPRPELERHLMYLESELGASGEGFFVGGHLTAADIMLSFPLSIAIRGRGGVFEQSKFPRLYEWYQTICKYRGYNKDPQV